jgi:glycine hydroxymethyltransferase
MQMKEPEMDLIAGFIDAVISRPNDEKGRLEVRQQVAELCKSFPVPGVSDVVKRGQSIRLVRQ